MGHRTEQRVSERGKAMPLGASLSCLGSCISLCGRSANFPVTTGTPAARSGGRFRQRGPISGSFSYSVWHQWSGSCRRVGEDRAWDSKLGQYLTSAWPWASDLTLLRSTWCPLGLPSSDALKCGRSKFWLESASAGRHWLPAMQGAAFSSATTISLPGIPLPVKPTGGTLGSRRPLQFTSWLS